MRAAVEGCHQRAAPRPSGPAQAEWPNSWPATVTRSMSRRRGGTATVHVSASSKWASPMIGVTAAGGTEGKKACASTPLGPSKGEPSPWSPATNRMMISGPAAIAPG